MRQPITRVLAGLLLIHVFSVVGHAQLVQVRPGYVKAPFVRVYRYPNGGSYVRAPFVAVDSPGYRSGYYIQEYVQPAADLGQMDWKALRLAIHESVGQLEAELRSFPTGEFWRAHLKTAEIRKLVAIDRDGPPNEEVRDKLQEILTVYKAANETRELATIARLSSFRTLRAAIEEFLTPPEPRLRRQVYTASRQLDRSLAQFSTGTGWQKYLALPQQDDADKNTDERKSKAPDRVALAKALERFDSVNQNDEFQVIAQVPTFKMTRERLAAYLDLLENPLPKPRPNAEELPRPKPNRN